MPIIPPTSNFGDFYIFSPETLKFVCFRYITIGNNYLLTINRVLLKTGSF